MWSMLFSNHETAAAPHKPEPATWDNDTITAAWIGHATILVNFYGAWIITDPVLSHRIGINVMGMLTLGPSRLVAPALTFEELPPIDLILLSHGHMDHLDIPTLTRFKSSVPVVMAKNTADILEGLPFKQVQELDWGEKTTVAGLEIEAFQVKHFGWRYPWEEDRSRGNWHGRSYNAYLITKNGNHIFFGGDTAYHDYFRELGERRLDIELAMMPIGAYDPWIFNHVNPEQSMMLADQIGAKHILPMHWGTFIQSEEPTTEPIQRLKMGLADNPDRIALEEIGQTWSLKGVEQRMLQTAG